MEPPRIKSRHRAIWSLPVVPALLLSGALLAGSATDRALFAAINAHGPDFALSASWLSVTGLGAVAFVLAAGIGLRWPMVPAAVLIVLLLGGAAIQAIKLLLATPRPLGVLGIDAVNRVGIALNARSMPSGHAAMMSALATMAWFASPARGRPALQSQLAWSLTLIAPLAALARVAVGAHWPSDILVGSGMGIGAGALVTGSGAGRRAVATLGARLTGRGGALLMTGALAATALSLWHNRHDYPLALGLSVALTCSGLLLSLAWWLRWQGRWQRVQRWSTPGRPQGGS